ncbi:MAG TPA: YIP1 family protein [Thermoanaerobaculia bacterium]|nr:YIP1 family protein [Thermoanaerobaculia bacterium]
MSSVPPPGSGYPPPPPPPPPPPGPPPVMPAGPGLAWETQAIGPESFLETAKTFIVAPEQAWKLTRESGDYARPLLFAVIVGWVGAIFNAVWSTMFGAGLMRMIPLQYQRYAMIGTGHGLLVSIILAPIAVVIGLFIGSAIFHVSFMIVGALSGSKSQFEGTFRVVSYSTIAHLGYLVPFVGGLVALVWRIFLMMLGAQQLHKTTQGKALAGILLPILLCCGCAVVGIVIGGAALFRAFGR